MCNGWGHVWDDRSASVFPFDMAVAREIIEHAFYVSDVVFKNRASQILINAHDNFMHAGFHGGERCAFFEQGLHLVIVVEFNLTQHMHIGILRLFRQAAFHEQLGKFFL